MRGNLCAEGVETVKNRRILLVLTGGTICTSIQNGLRSLSTDAAGVRLVENFRRSDSRFAACTEFVAGHRFDTLSENMTVAVWNGMVAYLRGISPEEFDGVIIAHGTDTLAYTAAMFALLLSGWTVPVFFVSSNAPLELGGQLANGDINFRAAVECIRGGIAPDVYVTYRNVSDRRVYLHLAARLTQCGNYSEDFFSVGAVDITGFENQPDTYFHTLRDQFTFSGESLSGRGNQPLLYELPGPLTDRVLKITPYVGLDYSAFDLTGFRAVLHGAYHSGTACVKDGNHSILSLIDRCAAAGIDVYISPARAYGDVYDTVPVMLNHNGRVLKSLYGMTDEAAYGKLIILYSHAALREHGETFLSRDFCGEMLV